MNKKARIETALETCLQRFLGGACGLALVCLSWSQGLAQTCTVLHSFGTNIMGLNPQGRLVQAADGMLYGTTAGGGAANKGQVFRVRADGTGFTALWDFSGGDGAYPAGGLLLVGTNLYGTTEGGFGSAGNGTLFKLNLDGSGAQVLWSFGQSAGDGYWPGAELVLSGTTLYGITSRGGSNDCGTVFRVNLDGTGYAILKHFAVADGREPRGGLVLWGTTLYGTTMQGGAADLGTIFRLNTSDGTYAVLKEFAFADGRYPVAALALDGTTLYGTTSIGGTADHGTVFKINTDGSGFVSLKSYDTLAEGHFPCGRLVVSGTTLYGTTFEGGLFNYGTVFTLNTDGSGFALLKSLGGADGAEPWAGLWLNGSVLYGTTSGGGPYNYGTLFQVNTDGSGFSTLTAFMGGDGTSPQNGLALAASFLFGTTHEGGSWGRGTIFKVSTNGTGYVRLHDFDGSSWGAPQGLLVVDENTIYGTTSNGGVSNYGNLFKLNEDGTGFTVLKDWSGGAEGGYPNSGLALVDQSLYGTTYEGGSSNRGTIFRMNLDGTSWTVLKSFAGADGAFPQSGLVAANGTLYGTTAAGGAFDQGTVFKVNTDGSGYALLKEFSGGSDGSFPGWALAVSGTTLYGTTIDGGDTGCGVVFRLDLDGSGFAVLKSFSGADGSTPASPLVVSGETLFGLTAGGGFFGNGTAFQLQTDGTGFGVLQHFDGTNGMNPNGALALSGATLYGTTCNGGALAAGLAFSLAPGTPTILSEPQDQTVDVDSDTSFQVDASGYPPGLSYQWLFNGTIIAGAISSLLQLTNVQWSQAGSYSVVVCNSYGCVTSLVAALTVPDPSISSQPANLAVEAGQTATFSVQARGSTQLSFQWLKNASPLNDGGNVSGAQSSALTITNASEGDMGQYCVVVTNAAGSVTSDVAWLTVTSGGVYSILHTLTDEEGLNAHGSLVWSGTTLIGSANEGGSPTYVSRGTIFELNTNGTGFQVIKNFTQPGNGDGPMGDMALLGTTLYGTTYMGGANGYGTLFKMSTQGTNFTVLKDFSVSDGAEPAGVRLFGETLYGVTGLVPVLFKIRTDGNNYTILRTFSNGWMRSELLLLGTDLYGVGGDDTLGQAGIFKVDTNGNNFTSVRIFTSAEGEDPNGGLLLSGGTFYGTMSSGGSNGFGTVFKLNTNGSDLVVLKHFAGYDGSRPVGDLVLLGDHLFGVTDGGGAADVGTLFMLNTDGTGFKVLKSFNGNDGAYPEGTLLRVGSTFYGVTRYGGAFNDGVVFALSLSSPPLVTPPSSQTAETGASVAFTVTAFGTPPPVYHWFFNVTNSLNGATNSSLELTNVQPSAGGAYTVVVTNTSGAVTSPPAMLAVIPRVERRTICALTLSGQTGVSLHVENRDALGVAGNWQALDTVTLSNPSQFYFDLRASLPPHGFYRTWHTNVLSPPSILDLHQVPAITLTGAIGSSVRVDYINQFGPVDAWVTNLATVTLTNTSQLYFDTSSIGQPSRLWRIVPVP